MLLAIDAGNTDVKYAFHDGHTWLLQQRVALNDFCVAPKQYLQQLPKQVLIANVAGPQFKLALEAAFPTNSLQWVKSTTHACGVTNLYDCPEQLGVDRWAMLIAARAVTQQPCVVASLGTALTVDMLLEEKYLGGVIAPGLQLMRSALTQGTYAVQPSNGHIKWLPTNTADAVATGLLYAILGVIEKSIFELEKHTQRPVLCILTGGNAPDVAPYLNRPVQVMDNLVLDGLLQLTRTENSL